MEGKMENNMEGKTKFYRYDNGASLTCVSKQIHTVCKCPCKTPKKCVLVQNIKHGNTCWFNVCVAVLYSIGAKVTMEVMKKALAEVRGAKGRMVSPNFLRKTLLADVKCNVYIASVKNKECFYELVTPYDNDQHTCLLPTFGNHYTVYYSESIAKENRCGESRSELTLPDKHWITKSKFTSTEAFSAEFTGINGKCLVCKKTSELTIECCFCGTQPGRTTQPDVSTIHNSWKCKCGVYNLDTGGKPCWKCSKPYTAPVPVTPAQWECTACTFTNSDAMTKCEMCATPAPVPVPSTPAPVPVPSTPAPAPVSSTPAQWACSACTFANNAAVSKCGICGTDKPAPAPAPVPPTPAQWTCTVCEHKNAMSANTCGSCKVWAVYASDIPVSAPLPKYAPAPAPTV